MWLILTCAKLPGLFTQASHWMGTKQDRADFPCVALDVSSGCSCSSELPHILKGPAQLQSIPPQIIRDWTPRNLGGLQGLISSADKDTELGTKLEHVCIHKWACGCNCAALTHTVALLNSLGASHHLIPLQNTSFISNSFPTMTGVSPSAFHHRSEACLLFFFVSFLGSDFLCDLP